MKFLLDENISNTVNRCLRDAGFDVVHVVEKGLLGHSDEDIMALANREHRIILTHDKDFGNLLRFPVQKHNGVIMMRFRNQAPRSVTPHLLNFFQRNKDMRLKARLVILREDGWRII